MSKKIKPVIEVRYYGGDAPVVVVPPNLEVEVKLIDQEKEDTRLLAYKGVEVFWTHNDYDIQSDYWVCTMPGCNLCHQDAFDLRDLPEVPETERQLLLAAAEHSLMDDSDKGYPDNMEEILQLMYCIEQGWLTEDGLRMPKEAR